MNIDEYLSQLRRYKQREDYLYRKIIASETYLTSPRSSLNVGDGIRIKSGENRNEIKMMKLVDDAREYREAHNQYLNFREELRSNIYNMVYWQGAILLQVYVYNVVFESEDDLRGVDDILNTSSHRAIISKLTEAKETLRRMLIDQGKEID